MNFKEFIKFRWRKLIISVITVILTLISLFISSFFFEFGSIGGPPTPQPFLYYLFLGITYILALPIFLALQLADLLIGTGFDYVIVILGFILTIPYVYFLACLVNLLIEKIKNKTQP